MRAVIASATPGASKSFGRASSSRRLLVELSMTASLSVFGTVVIIEQRTRTSGYDRRFQMFTI